MRGFSGRVPFAVACIAILVVTVAAQNTNCEVADVDDFAFMHSPQDGFFIYWTVPARTVSFMVEAEAEEWTAIGFSEDGMMVGSDAVVFLPEPEASEDDSEPAGVGEHILGSKSVTDILPSENSDLSETSFEQNGNTTTFWFTRNTSPGDSSGGKLTIPNTPNQDIYLIWAKGMDNGFGFHGVENSGSFLVDLFCPTAGANSTTPAPSMTNAVTGAPTSPLVVTPAPVMMAPTSAPTAGSRGFTIPPTGAATPLTPVPAMITASPLAAAATGAPVSRTPAPAVMPTSSAAESRAPVGAAPSAGTAGTTAPLEGETAGTPAPSAGDRDAVGAPSLEEIDGTAAPTMDITGFVAGAARNGGGVTVAAVTSSLAAVGVGALWARRT